jgi:hypothetical protein
MQILTNPNQNIAVGQIAGLAAQYGHPIRRKIAKPGFEIFEPATSISALNLDRVWCVEIVKRVKTRLKQ